MSADWRESTTMSVEQAAKVLGISRSGAYVAVKEGRIPSILVGKKMRRVPTHRLRVLLGEAVEHADCIPAAVVIDALRYQLPERLDG